MGMFDSVVAPCPKCGEPVMFQSKAGPCELKEYPLDCVPPEVAANIHRDEQRCTCGALLRIMVAPPVRCVAMMVNTVEGK